MAVRTTWLACLIFIVVSHALVIFVRPDIDMEEPCHDIDGPDAAEQRVPVYELNIQAINDDDADSQQSADPGCEEDVLPLDQITDHHHLAVNHEAHTEESSQQSESDSTPSSARKDLKKRLSRRDPEENFAVVPVYGQCGGKDWTGLNICESGTECRYQTEWYSQCEYTPAPEGTVDRWGQCGGKDYTGLTSCRPDTVCQYQSEWYSQCV